MRSPDCMDSEKGQAAVWGMLLTAVFLLVVAALVDVYCLVETRNWAYAVAQEAALGGASRGRDWRAVVSSGQMKLDEALARREAVDLVEVEMASRGVTAYNMDVRVLPNPDGGAIPGYPPRPVRLGDRMGEWSTSEPAVGVYLELAVDTPLLKFAGLSSGIVYTFVAAGVVQPEP